MSIKISKSTKLTFLALAGPYPNIVCIKAIDIRKVIILFHTEGSSDYFVSFFQTLFFCKV